MIKKSLINVFPLEKERNSYSISILGIGLTVGKPKRLSGIWFKTDVLGLSYENYEIVYVIAWQVSHCFMMFLA